ncbi:2Fe-2S iron-sulfur cluster-binding protein [Flavobacterium weaverense]|uniref:2Fe-2S iron-sulfur cluster protein n=1 Tax=Flavobacterium weaverense TaxID=271156 RepID=A0A3L9ZW64_9FLAO|nr:2Fe-2S iron-sulfur cluster-binding protein [Flavobacterium weaverense]RMA76943.1 2Fe-2S iron-sulfur cluster protein [Flavobacterium weaverense]
MTQKPIQFTVIDNDYSELIETQQGSYPNLMFLLRDKLGLEGFGECGGVGRCATCIITAEGITGNSIIKDRNEPATLSKMGYEDESTRLSCQLYITSDLDGATITILDL